MGKSDITQLLEQSNRGDVAAGRKALELLYEKLRPVAGRKMSSQPSDHTWQPTELLSEMSIKVLNRGQLPHMEHSKNLYLYCARAMVTVLVDHARHRATVRAGGEWARLHPSEDQTPEDVIDLGGGCTIHASADPNIIDLANAMEQLDEELREVIELNYWMGLTDKEAAVVLGIKASDVYNRLRRAKTRLGQLLEGSATAS